MDINGPLSIKVINDTDSAGYQLLVDFTPAFRTLEHPAQGGEMRAYLRDLETEIDRRDEDDRNRAGMLMVHQIAESLLPYVESGELALEQTIVIQVGEDAPVVSLTDLLAK